MRNYVWKPTPASEAMSDAIDAEVAPRRIEFCCDVCLFSAYASDAGPWPRCPRCGIKLTPDIIDAPRVRVTRERVTGAKRAPQ